MRQASAFGCACGTGSSKLVESVDMPAFLCFIVDIGQHVRANPEQGLPLVLGRGAMRPPKLLLAGAESQVRRGSDGRQFRTGPSTTSTDPRTRRRGHYCLYRHYRWRRSRCQSYNCRRRSCTPTSRRVRTGRSASGLAAQNCPQPCMHGEEYLAQGKVKATEEADVPAERDSVLLGALPARIESHQI